MLTTLAQMLMWCWLDKNTPKSWLSRSVCLCVCVFQRMDTTLSSIQEKVNQGQCPLPLFTCLHVKPNVSELMFAGKTPLVLWWLFIDVLDVVVTFDTHVENIHLFKNVQQNTPADQRGHSSYLPGFRTGTMLARGPCNYPSCRANRYQKHLFRFK